jgi:hypothetical protein
MWSDYKLFFHSWSKSVLHSKLCNVMFLFWIFGYASLWKDVSQVQYDNCTKHQALSCNRAKYILLWIQIWFLFAIWVCDPIIIKWQNRSIQQKGMKQVKWSANFLVWNGNVCQYHVHILVIYVLVTIRYAGYTLYPYVCSLKEHKIRTTYVHKRLSFFTHHINLSGHLI